MLSRDADAQQRQQGMHRGFRAADGAQGGLRSVDESNRSARVVKGVKGYVDCPFDLAPGLAQIHDACVRSLGGGEAEEVKKPDTRAEQSAKSSTAAKLMAVVQSTSSKRKPEARSKDSYRAGVGAHRLTREAAAEQRKAIAPRLTFEQIAEEEVPLDDADEDDGNEADKAKAPKKKGGDVDAATAIARMARLGAGISDAAEAANDEPHSRTEAAREKERVARQLVRQSNATQLAEYDAKRHRSEGFVRPPTAAEEGDASDDDSAIPGGALKQPLKQAPAVSPRHPATAASAKSPKASPKAGAPVSLPPRAEEEALEEFADEPPADPLSAAAGIRAPATACSLGPTAGGANKANKAEMARLRGIYAKTKKRR